MAKTRKMADQSKAAKAGGARTGAASGGMTRGLVKGTSATKAAGTGAGTREGRDLTRKVGAGKLGRTKNSAMGLKYNRVTVGEAAAAGFSTDIVAEKDIRLDAKKRATLTGAEFEHYHMVVTADGTIVLEPRVLAPATLSKRTLAMMDGSMGSFAAGNVGDAIDFDRYREVLEEKEE